MATLRIQPVQSLDAPELAWYRTLRRIEEHERAGVLVATNAKVVRRLLASRFTVVSALLTPAWLEKLAPLLRARPEGEIHVYVGEQKLLETITGYQLHQGALAVFILAQKAGRIPRTTILPGRIKPRFGRRLCKRRIPPSLPGTGR